MSEIRYVKKQKPRTSCTINMRESPTLTDITPENQSQLGSWEYIQTTILPPQIKPNPTSRFEYTVHWYQRVYEVYERIFLPNTEDQMLKLIYQHIVWSDDPFHPVNELSKISLDNPPYDIPIESINFINSFSNTDAYVHAFYDKPLQIRQCSPNECFYLYKCIEKEQKNQLDLKKELELKDKLSKFQQNQKIRNQQMLKLKR